MRESACPRIVGNLPAWLGLSRGEARSDRLAELTSRSKYFDVRNRSCKAAAAGGQTPVTSTFHGLIQMLPCHPLEQS
jgi:hypothetical protein